MWSINATTGILTHAGTSLEVAATSASLSTDAVVVVQCFNPNRRIRVRILMSPDARSGWDCGVDESDNTMCTIRASRLGVQGPIVASYAHGLPIGSNNPYTLEVSIQGTTLTVRTYGPGGVTDRSASYNIPDGEFLGYRGFGIVTDASGAQCAVTWFPLNQSRTSETDAYLEVVGGRLYVAMDETNQVLIGGRSVATSTGTCSIATMDRIAYIVAPGPPGQPCINSRFDPTTMAVTEWIPTAGTFPWMTADAIADQVVPVIHSHFGRMYAAVGNTLWASASGFPDNWDETNITLGTARAFHEPARDKILSLNSLPNSHMLVGCNLRIKQWIGDPIFGTPQLVDLTDAHGVSGPTCFAQVEGADTSIGASDGESDRAYVGGAMGVVHSPDGVFLLRSAGLPVALFDEVLTEGIQIPRNQRDNYIVNVVHDPLRRSLHFFLTPVATASSDQWVYEERVGGYTPNKTGLMRERYPASVGPMTAILWRGHVLLGTRDGLTMSIDNDAVTDDGVAIDSFMPFNLLADAEPVGDTLVSFCHLMLADGSDPVKVTLYTGMTAEQVYDPDARQRRFSATQSPGSAPITSAVRGRAVLAQISSSGSGTTWEHEMMVVTREPCQTLVRRGYKAALPVGIPCPSPVTASPPSPPPPPGTGPGAGGGPPAPPPPPPTPPPWTNPPAGEPSGPPPPPPGPPPQDPDTGVVPDIDSHIYAELGDPWNYNPGPVVGVTDPNGTIVPPGPPPPPPPPPVPTTPDIDSH